MIFLTLANISFMSGAVCKALVKTFVHFCNKFGIALNLII